MTKGAVVVRQQESRHEQHNRPSWCRKPASLLRLNAEACRPAGSSSGSPVVSHQVEVKVVAADLQAGTSNTRTRPVGLRAHRGQDYSVTCCCDGRIVLSRRPSGCATTAHPNPYPASSLCAPHAP